ncbi:hypothetical protein AB4Z09_18940 [Rhodococcus sp. TAF43]|uniref:hypothetical protein n=1 Tax=Rhodococcus sp. TAF43 TaxID=3237483 RepID=UPI003F9C8AE4
MTGILVPFHGRAALDRDLVSRRRLRRHYTRIYPDTYLHNDIEVDTVKARQLIHGRPTLIAQITRVLCDAGAPV